MTDVDGRRHVAHEFAQICVAADVSELFLFFEGVGDREDIDRLVFHRELYDHFKDNRVFFGIKHLWGEEVDDLVDRGRAEHERAEHRLLGFEVVGRDTEV